MLRLPVGLAAVCFSLSALAADPFDDKFRQLDEVLPTGNAMRNAAGAPFHFEVLSYSAAIERMMAPAPVWACRLRKTLSPSTLA